MLDIPATRDAEAAAESVRLTLRNGRFEGVVVLGGYGVVPAHRLDVLDAASRRALEKAGPVGQDADDFIVWSDEIYGDRDGDFIPELCSAPSRLVDSFPARESELLLERSGRRLGAVVFEK